MTVEEAISYLESIPKYIDYNKEDYYAVSWEILEAIQQAIEALKAQRWISCSERLPEDKQRVIIQMYNGYMEIIEFSTIGLTDHILAWMPLPEPYMRGE